jgi:FixJ family two-component response regulator
MNNRKSIVYVIGEDEPAREAFGVLVRSADISVELFPSPDDFLMMTHRRTDNACILLDIGMPGTTGFQFMEAFAARQASLPVIIVSASDDAHIRERARELGAAAFFRKPVDDQALLDAIWWAISGSGGKHL